MHIYYTNIAFKYTPLEQVCISIWAFDQSSW